MLVWTLLSAALVYGTDCSTKSSYPGTSTTYPYELETLPYAYDFLSDYLSQRIVSIHYNTHTKAYLTKLNSFISLNLKYNETGLESLVSEASGSANLEKFAGGLYNHYLYFWTMTATNCSSASPSGTLLTAIKSAWTTFEAFQAAFESSASSVFGNGWTWLCVRSSGLAIMNTEFQESPLMETGSNKCYPILGIDLWEHAYYLKFLASRASYVTGYWNAVDWDVVQTFYEDFASKLTPVPF